MKKRGYFFMLDAVLGMFILVIGIFLITSSYINLADRRQTGLIAGDLMGFLSTTRIKDTNNQYAGIGGVLWNNGTISNPDNTMLQQIGELYYRRNMNAANSFVRNVSQEIVPYQYRYEVWIDNRIIYPQLQPIGHNSSKNSTKLLLTSKKIIFGVANKTTAQLWGPYKAEVFVWQNQ